MLHRKESLTQEFKVDQYFTLGVHKASPMEMGGGEKVREGEKEVVDEVVE